MKDFAFISRHAPTIEQIAMAAEQGIALSHIGDADAFSITADFVDEAGQFHGVVVVHPAAAMRLCNKFAIGVFENANRAEVGQPPKFFPKALHVYDMVYFPGLCVTFRSRSVAHPLPLVAQEVGLGLPDHTGRSQS